MNTLLDGNVIANLVTTAGAILVALGGWVAGAHKSRVEAERQADANNVAKWETMLESQRQGFEVQLESQRQGFEAQLEPLRVDARELRGDVNGLRDEVEVLRKDIASKDGLIAALVDYARYLLTEWKIHLPARPAPQPPDSVTHLI